MGNMGKWGEMGENGGEWEKTKKNGTTSKNALHIGPYNTFSIMVLGLCH